MTTPSRSNIFTTSSGQLLATPGVRVKEPWVISASKKNPGHYFFFNTTTKRAAWTLDISLLDDERSIQNLPSIKNGPATAKASTRSASVSNAALPSLPKAPDQTRATSEPAILIPILNRTSFLEEARETINSGSLEVIGGLGKGGFGDVVRVKDTQTGKTYAMKVIDKAGRGGRRAHERVKMELRALTEVAPFPYISKCHLAFESPTSVLLVSDICSGGDLYFHLPWGFSENDSRVVLAELALAIEHVHGQGFIHKDIKPENVMFDHNGHVKLVDFGLATPFEEEPMPMALGGSLPYISPELMRDRTGGRHTDWWAYGILAYELLTTYTPWSSLEDNRIIKHDIQFREIPFPCDMLSPRAIQFLQGLLQRDYRRRLCTKSEHEFKAAAFFEDIDWEGTAQMKCAPAALVVTKIRSSNPFGDRRSKETISSYVSKSEILAVGNTTFYVGLHRVDENPRVSRAVCTLP